MGNEFSVQTLKVKSKMASSRMKAHIQKKENAMTKQRREIAKLLVDEKEQSARIKVEGIIREENLCRVMEWLEMMCELIHQRVKQIQLSKECPEDLTECICTILYCAKRMDIPELTEMGRQFAGKWGQKWLEENIENRSGRVSKQIIEKLSPEPPTREMVVKKLQGIADEFDVSWKPNTLEKEETMPAIIGHRNEYTVEFDSKPFGMEWTATEDGKNLWVSSIDPKSESARKGVVPGSLLMALNGIDIKDLGAKVIHQKASSCGLPLRITFRKPEGMNAPTYSKDMSVNTDIVNKCVALLKDPNNWEMSDSQREAMCKKQGANAAEVASALFLAKYMIENMSQQPAPEYKPMSVMGYPGPSNSDFPPPSYSQPPPQNYSQPSPNYSQPPPQAYSQPPMDGNMTYGPGSPMDHMDMHDHESQPMSNSQDLDLPDVPSSSKPSNPSDLDDLEARFANLKKGL